VKAVADLHGPLLGRAINPTTEVLITHGANPRGVWEPLLCLPWPGMWYSTT